METSKVPTSTSTAVSSTSATLNPLFDPVALQTAYLAATQLHNQLQQNCHLAATVDTAAVSASAITTTNANNVHVSLHKTTTPPLSPVCLPSFAGNDRLHPLLPLQLQRCLKQQQSVNTSLAHHFSAFSPINGDLLGAASSTAPLLLTQPTPLPPIPPVPPTASPQQAIDFLLMQMQMATAAVAAGFFPTAYNVLPPGSATLGLLAPQFRMMQFGDPKFSAHSALTNTSGVFPADAMNKCSGDTSAVERALLQAQINLLANGSSLLSAGNEHTCSNGTSVSNASLNSVTSSLMQQRNPSLNHNSSHHDDGKQQRMQLKRSYSEMSILRSLCSENPTTEQDTTMISSKRSRLAVTDIGRQGLHISTKGRNQQQNFVVGEDLSNGISKRDEKSAEECETSQLFNEDSPDRHHPLNHRPPAMEARFLECMAAIALHSNIPLPVNDENSFRSANVDGSRIEENKIVGKSGKLKHSTGDIEPENSRTVKLTSISSPDELGFNENTSTTITLEENGKKYWPNSAIDEELCKELENYKDSNVPMIHAFVLPAKHSDSASSPTSDEKYSQNAPCTMVPESVTVPVPILNTLLDRILQTMLES